MAEALWTDETSRDRDTARDPFVHPETGELLEVEADYRRALDAIEEQMVPYWRLRRRIQEAFADRFDVELPPRLKRTADQDLVARCPRCRRVVSPEDAEEVALVERFRIATRRSVL